MRKKLIFLGDGDLSNSIFNYISEVDSSGTAYEFSGYYSDSTNSIWNNMKRLGSFSEYENIKPSEHTEVIIGLGYKHLRTKEKIFSSLKLMGIKVFTFVHPSSYVSPLATVGEGSILFPRVTLDQGVVIGEGCILNTGVLVAHDSKIGSFTFMSPTAKTAGFVDIGRGCFIGIGATVSDNVSICPDTTIGAHSLVLKSIQSPGIYVGSPVQLLRDSHQDL